MHHDWTKVGPTSISVMSSKKDHDCNDEPHPGYDAEVAVQIYTAPGIHIAFSLPPDKARDLAERLARAAMHAECSDAQIIDFNLQAEAA